MDYFNIDIKKQEDALNELLRTIDFEDTNPELNPESSKARRELADKDDLQFAKIYFPQIFNEPFNELHLHIASLKSGNYTVSGSRRFGKSTFTYITKVIKPICLGFGKIINISMRTKELALARSYFLVRLLKRNRMLMYDYKINIQRDKIGNYLINDTSFVANSVEVGLRTILDENFNRIGISINDDLYNKNSVRSQNDNEKVFDYITSEVYGQMENDGLSITLGNSISENCPIIMLKEDNPDNHFSLPALNEKGETNWPGHSVYTTPYLVTQSKTIPFDVWQGEYMDQPLVKGEIFNIEWLRFNRIAKDDIITSITVIDPSTGQSPSACDKGIVTLGLTRNGDCRVIDIYIRKEGYNSVFDYISRISVRSPGWKGLLFENDFNQFFVAKPYYDRWKSNSNKTIPIIHFSAKDLKSEFYASDKESRILNLVLPHQTGELTYNEDIKNTSDFKKFRAQYISFGKNKTKLDGLDALASAYILIQRYTNQGTFKSLADRVFKSRSLFR